MTRSSAITRHIGFALFALALGLLSPQAATAAPPRIQVGVPGNAPPPPPLIDPTLIFPNSIYNVVVSAPQYSKGIVTATVSFDTVGPAQGTVTWGTQCQASTCEFPLPGGFDGYDATGYFVQHIVGAEGESPNGALTHHVFVLSDLVPGIGYDFLVGANFPGGPVHTFYGRFQSGELVIG